MKRKQLSRLVTYLIILVLGIALLFPILYMFMASFKTNTEIFGTTKLLPERFSLDHYIRGWQGNGQFDYLHFFKNTFLLVIPTVLLTVISFMNLPRKEK